MTTKHKMARARTLNRGCGWYSWYLQDGIGSTITSPDITCSGREKGKQAATIQARLAAEAYNARHTPKEEPRRPKQPPSVAKAGEHTEGFYSR